MAHAKRCKSVKIEARKDRAEFWGYCKQTAYNAKNRSALKGFPYAIDAHVIDRLLVDQGWCCAVSGVPLNVPGEREKYCKDPFGPSLDRIVPSLGYVPGNVRVVSNIVNGAMNEWGVDALMTLVRAMRPPALSPSPDAGGRHG